MINSDITDTRCKLLASITAHVRASRQGSEGYMQKKISPAPVMMLTVRLLVQKYRLNSFTPGVLCLTSATRNFFLQKHSRERFKETTHQNQNYSQLVFPFTKSNCIHNCACVNSKHDRHNSFETDGKSLMKIKNKSGPKHDSCGTPHCMLYIQTCNRYTLHTDICCWGGWRTNLELYHEHPKERI